MRSFFLASAFLMGLVSEAAAAEVALIPHVPNNAVLSATKSTAYPSLIRDSVTTLGDSIAASYISSNSACSLNSGAGDGGSQVPSADGKCWLSNVPAPYDPRMWGASYPVTLTVSIAGSDSTNGFANYCLNPTFPCRTVGHAVDIVNKMYVANQPPTINIGAGAFVERISQDGPLSGAAENSGPIIGIQDWEKGGANAIHLVGAGSGSTTIQSATTEGDCYTLLTNYGGALYLSGMTVKYQGICNGGSAIYGQAQGIYTFGPDVVIAGTSTNAIIGEERAFFWQQPGGSLGSNLKITGTFTQGIALSDSLFESDPPIDFNGTFTNVLVGTDNSTFKLAGNPPAEVAAGGSVTGRAFALSGNSSLLTYNSGTLPGTPGLVGTGAIWDGAVPPTTVQSTTGLGTGGTATFTFSGADPYHGTITLASGTGSSSNGTVVLAWPYSHGLSCIVGNQGGWPNTASFNLTYIIDATHPTIAWATGGAALNTGGGTTAIAYICR